MAAGGGGGGSSTDKGDVLLLGVLIIILALGGWYLTHDGDAQVALTVSYYETKAISYIPFYGSQWADLVATIPQINPDRMSFSNIADLLSAAGAAWRFPFLVFSMAMAWSIYRKAVTQRFAERINFKSMVKIQSRNFPVILPAVRSKLNDEQREEGPWRRFDIPYEWAMQHDVLEPPSDWPEDKPYDYAALLQFFKGAAFDVKIEALPRINERRARSAFVQELTRWRGADQMAPHRQALIAAMAVWINGDYLDERYAPAGGNRLFAHYNRSYSYFDLCGPPFLVSMAKRSAWFEKTLKKKKKIWDVTVPRIDPTPGIEALKDEAVQKTIARFVAKHAFEETILTAMMESCNGLMLLPTQNFLWLKPIDRLLFYVLDSLGTNGGWSVGGGAVAHYRVEIYNERRIEQPQVDLAVGALVRELTDFGWASLDSV